MQSLARSVVGVQKAARVSSSSPRGLAAPLRVRAAPRAARVGVRASAIESSVAAAAAVAEQVMPAEATQAVADLAASNELFEVALDGRLILVPGILVVALGWVAFNIFPGLLNQIETMAEKNDSATKKKRGLIAAGAGLSAAAFAAPESAQAAQQLQEVALDGRLILVPGILVVALGWVAFNIFPGLLNQIETMAEKNDSATKKKR